MLLGISEFYPGSELCRRVPDPGKVPDERRKLEAAILAAWTAIASAHSMPWLPVALRDFEPASDCRSSVGSVSWAQQLRAALSF